MIKNRNLDPRENKKNIEIELNAWAANDISFAWENPEKSPIAVTRALLLISKAGGTATSVMDVGATTSATGTDNTIFKWVDINTATLYDNLSAALYDTYTEARSVYLDANWGTTSWITGKILTEKAEDLVWKIYLEYKVL